MIGLRKIAVIGLISTGAATSCGRSQNSAAEVTDTNTNWLESCDVDVQCGGLTCICGQCSRECERDEDCARFGDSARCAELSGSTCERQTACVNRDETSGMLGSDATCTGCETSSGTDGTSQLSMPTSEPSGTTGSDSAQSVGTSTQSAASTAELGTSSGDGETLTQDTASDSSTSGDECAGAVDGEPCGTEGASCGSVAPSCQ